MELKNHKKNKDTNSNRLYFLNENKIFLFCMTVEIARNYHIDTIYKVMFPDLPLLVFGCSEANRKFHSIFLAIIYEKTFVMLDIIF